jgi:hypothetical protein
MDVEVGAPAEATQLDAFRARVRTRLVEHGQMAGVPLGEAFAALTDL